MKKIFARKKLSFLVVYLALVPLILLLILITVLSQKASLEAKVVELQTKIEQAKQNIISHEELLEYRNSNEYVYNWAVEHEMVSPDDDVWQQK